MKTDIHFLSNLAPFFVEWKIFQAKSCRLWDNVEKGHRWQHGACALHARYL